MDINQNIVDMYNNKTYQELKDYYGKTTIFNVLGIERNENRHSAFLRWLFDNRSSHGLRDEPIKKLLRLYALHMQKNENPALNIMLMAGNYDLEISEIITEKSVKKSNGKDGRIDIWARMTISDKEEDNIVSLVLIIENKIYSNERDNQTKEYHNYFENTKGIDDIPIEIYLTPKGAKKPNCDSSFKHITYPELLKDVILPLINMAMPEDALQIITDYVRNLSKPSNEGGKGYSVIATSEEEANKLKVIFDEFKDLYYSALIAGNMEQIMKTLGNKQDIESVAKFLQNLELISLDSSQTLKKEEYITIIQRMDNRQLLEAFWNSNEDLFKAILPQIDKKELPIEHEKIFKESHRDTSRYSVSVNGKSYGNRLFKNRAANAIFRAYIEREPSITLDELKKVFPGEINLYYHDRLYQHLFYDASTIDPPFDAPNFQGKQISGDINWDFLYEEKYLLPIENGNKKVMSVKMWRKDDFDRLLDKIKQSKDLQCIKVERS